MRTILFVAVLLFALGWIGWVKFSSPEGDPTIRVDSDKVKQDTAVIIEKSKDAFDDASNNIDESVGSAPVSE